MVRGALFSSLFYVDFFDFCVSQVYGMAHDGISYIYIFFNDTIYRGCLCATFHEEHDVKFLVSNVHVKYKIRIFPLRTN